MSSRYGALLSKESSRGAFVLNSLYLCRSYENLCFTIIAELQEASSKAFAKDIRNAPKVISELALTLRRATLRLQPVIS